MPTLYIKVECLKQYKNSLKKQIVHSRVVLDPHSNIPLGRVVDVHTDEHTSLLHASIELYAPFSIGTNTTDCYLAPIYDVNYMGEFELDVLTIMSYPSAIRKKYISQEI